MQKFLLYSSIVVLLIIMVGITWSGSQVSRREKTLSVVSEQVLTPQKVVAGGGDTDTSYPPTDPRCTVHIPLPIE